MSAELEEPFNHDLAERRIGDRIALASRHRHALWVLRDRDSVLGVGAGRGELVKKPARRYRHPNVRRVACWLRKVSPIRESIRGRLMLVAAALVPLDADPT